MDKRQFAEEVINSVRSLSLTSVLSTRMHLKVNRGGYSKGLCPFHNDHTIGSFVATESKGIWKCFSCGTGGDAVKFVALMEDINYLESAFRLALEFGIITRSEYEEYYERRRYSRDLIVNLQTKYEALDRQKVINDIADVETLDTVFRIFIKSSSLSEDHKSILMNERHLSEEEVADGLYFTFPTRRILKEFCNTIREKHNGNEDVLDKVPGFYFDKKESRYTFTTHKGIGIGIKNADGKVVGIQIRHDKKAEGKSRYIWFSSSFANFDEKYEKGTSSGSPVDVVYPTTVKNNLVFITEGRFKAQQIAKEQGSIAISVQGVSSWKGVLKALQQIPHSPVVKRLVPNRAFHVYAIMAAFDADMNYKPQVFEQLKKMTTSLEGNGYFVYYLSWDDALGKGIDDLFINGHSDAFRRYDKQAWDKAYENMTESLLDVEGYTNIKDVPEEMIRRYFKSEMKILPLAPGKPSAKHEEAIQKKNNPQQAV